VDFKTTFEIDVTPHESNFLKYWSTAPSEEWKALNDPDNAVAIPVAIDQKSLTIR
jgi:hypothetical protein